MQIQNEDDEKIIRKEGILPYLLPRIGNELHHGFGPLFRKGTKRHWRHRRNPCAHCGHPHEMGRLEKCPLRSPLKLQILHSSDSIHLIRDVEYVRRYERDSLPMSFIGSLDHQFHDHQIETT